MATLTIPEFKRRLLSLSNARGTVLERATSKAAFAIKREAYSSAVMRVRRTPKAKPFWVRYEVTGNPEGATGWVGPRGGFAYLGDLGSYKHPNGYPVRSHKRRARFAEVGVRRAGWHPPIPAQPWWSEGVERAMPSVNRIYAEAVVAEVRKHF